MKKYKTNIHMSRITMVIFSAILLFMVMLGWGLGLFTEIEEEPYINEEENLIVVGISQLVTNPAGELHIRNRSRGRLQNRMDTS